MPRRGDASEDLDGHFRAWNEPLLGGPCRELGVTLDADAGAAQEAALPGAGGPTSRRSNPIHGGTGALPMRVLANRDCRSPSIGPQHAAYRGWLLPDWRQLPRRRSPQHRPQAPPPWSSCLAPLRFAPGAHVCWRRARARRANLPVGEAIAVHRLLSEFVRTAASGDAQAHPGHGAAPRCPFTRPQARGAAREERSAPNFRQAKGPCSTCWRTPGLRAAVRGVPGTLPLN